MNENPEIFVEIIGTYRQHWSSGFQPEAFVTQGLFGGKPTFQRMT